MEKRSLAAGLHHGRRAVARRGWTPVLRTVGACLALAAAGLAQGQELTDRVRAILNTSKLGPARVGVCVMDAESGAVLAAVDAAGSYSPASNMKLLTTGAALKVLGPDFTFRTEFILVGDRLVVKGSGDPAFADPDLLEQLQPKRSVADVLGVLAEAVAKAAPPAPPPATGVALAEIVVDDRVFDRETVHPSWPADQLNERYCAQVSGLNFHANILSVFAYPALEGIGRPPRITTDPEAPWLEFENRARTIGQKKVQFSLLRRPDTNHFVVSGEVGMASQGPVSVTLDDNPRFLGELLRSALSKAGVAVGRKGGPAPVRLPAETEKFEGGKVVAVVTTPMREILERANSDSCNLYADCLVKRLGHDVTGAPGSWANGGSVLRMTIGDVLSPGDAAAAVISDGSGLSRDNRVTPALLTKWLVALSRDRAIGPAYIDSMATPGRGTFKHRFGDVALRSDLHGKSGTIKGVRALSGYLTSATGRRLAFCILVNNKEEPGAGAFDPFAAKKFQDDVVVMLDKWLTAKAAAETPALGG
jgi:serine-type D-Ala-D-Ala carboxypeptidase/endopeptidase (penicillin-binding protein 4)